MLLINWLLLILDSFWNLSHSFNQDMALFNPFPTFVPTRCCKWISDLGILLLGHFLKFTLKRYLVKCINNYWSISHPQSSAHSTGLHLCFSSLRNLNGSQKKLSMSKHRVTQPWLDQCPLVCRAEQQGRVLLMWAVQHKLSKWFCA